MPAELDKNRPPDLLRGLRQAIFVLQSLADGKSEAQITDSLQGDTQLTQIWVSFVFHNHWVKKVELDGGATKWVLTDKGRELIEKYD